MKHVDAGYAGPDPNEPPDHALPGGRPEGLPISVTVWEASAGYGRHSEAVVKALYEAVKSLESEVIQLSVEK